ncbi:hypothetical protein K2X85_03260 [bacterium]|nr:hypothetical protein [bacterium]
MAGDNGLLAMSTAALQGYSISISVGRDGTFESAYIGLRRGHVERTKEFASGSLLVDYLPSGKVRGIEVIGPFRGEELKAIVDAAAKSQQRGSLVPMRDDG